MFLSQTEAERRRDLSVPHIRRSSSILRSVSRVCATTSAPAPTCPDNLTIPLCTTAFPKHLCSLCDSSKGYLLIYRELYDLPRSHPAAAAARDTPTILATVSVDGNTDLLVILLLQVRAIQGAKTGSSVISRGKREKCIKRL